MENRKEKGGIFRDNGAFIGAGDEVIANPIAISLHNIYIYFVKVYNFEEIISTSKSYFRIISDIVFSI